jgi:hypothetical protein
LKWSFYNIKAEAPINENRAFDPEIPPQKTRCGIMDIRIFDSMPFIVLWPGFLYKAMAGLYALLA